MHNPYNFQHFNLSEISIFADSQNVQNIKLLKLTTVIFCSFIFNSLFTSTSRLNHGEGLGIDRLDYPDGYALYTFDLSPDLTDDEKFHQLRTGSVRLQLKFSQQLVDPIALVIYTKYQNLIEIGCD